MPDTDDDIDFNAPFVPLPSYEDLLARVNELEAEQGKRTDALEAADRLAAAALVSGPWTGGEMGYPESCLYCYKDTPEHEADCPWDAYRSLRAGEEATPHED